jgi:DNA-binding LacI/PurR family transcriptional regulator
MARSTTIKIYERLKKELLTGKYCRVDFLPSERQLGESLDTGRGVIRTALRKLRDEGIINIVPGRGAQICRSKKMPQLKRFLVRFAGNASPSHAYESMGIFTGICTAAAENNCEVVVSFAEENIFINEVISRYGKGELQGVIFVECWYSEKTIPPLQASGVPYVIANQEADCDYACTKVNFRNIGRQAGRYLVKHGYREIGVVAGHLSKFIYKEMMAGFRGALAEDEIIVRPENIVEVDQEATTRQYNNICNMLNAPTRPKAIFAMRDNRAAHLYQACHQLGIAIPEELSVISYDNISWLQASSLGLTTIEQPVEMIGKKAVEMLNDWYVSGQHPRNQILNCKLIERKSVL